MLIGCSCADGQRTSVLLVTLDTTRADALTCNGGPPGITPNLDRLASEGVLYTQARTVAPLTLPAHASMMTGLWPIRHSARANTLTALPDDALTLAEMAQEGGVSTAAFVAASVLDRSLGIAQGFEAYDQPPRPQQISVTTHFPERPANEVLEAATTWLAARDRGRPFFLWVHFFDPHFPYAPPQDAKMQAGGQPYLGEVAFMDRAVGDLMRALESDGDPGETFVVVVGDHGEDLGQHGESSHGALCYDSTIRVPLILRYPDGYRAGERSAEPVSVVDVFPTVAEALGLDPAEDVDGLSLYRREVPDGRGVYFESLDGFIKYGWSPIFGWADADGKYLHGATAELYDVANDLLETRDLAGSTALPERYPVALREVAAMERLEAAGPVDPELVESLKSLGYVGGVGDPSELPEPLEPTDLPDARDRLWELAHVSTALERGEQGRFDEGIALLREVVAGNPRNSVAQDWLATYLVHTGKCEDAMVVLREMLSIGIEFGSTHNNFGHCLLEAGEDEEALVHFKRALELDPGNPIPPHNIVLVLERLGRADEARRYREMAGQSAP